jgi:hypothetical protein
MLVKVLGFGTNWWARFGRDADDPHRFTRHAAYYNSTGVRCGVKVRRHWIDSGLIRFNGVGDFNPNFPERAIGHTFVCSDLAYAFGGNRLLFQSKAAKLAAPDCYLVVISAVDHGRIDFTSTVWKSAFSRVIAASQLRDKQEVMLLMKTGDWVQTCTGFWQLCVQSSSGERDGLVRIGEQVSA